MYGKKFLKSSPLDQTDRLPSKMIQSSTQVKLRLFKWWPRVPLWLEEIWWKSDIKQKVQKNTGKQTGDSEDSEKAKEKWWGAQCAGIENCLNKKQQQESVTASEGLNFWETRLGHNYPGQFWEMSNRRIRYSSKIDGILLRNT